MLQCKIDGCGREAMYVSQKVCQKHYFRFMRKGHYELEPRSYRAEQSAGYQLVWEPNHPLVDKRGYVYEHRYVLFSAIGHSSMVCALCGISLTWRSCRVDHIDRDVRNNAPWNLRPTCNTCNTRRDMRPPTEWSRTYSLTFDGVTRTAHDWTRDERVMVSTPTIIRRKKRGATDFEALFGPKRTHKTGGPKRPAPTASGF